MRDGAPIRRSTPAVARGRALVRREEVAWRRGSWCPLAGKLALRAPDFRPPAARSHITLPTDGHLNGISERPAGAPGRGLAAR